MYAAGADRDANAELLRALLHTQGEQPEDADGAQQQCDGGEGGREDGDDALTSKGSIDLIAEGQEAHDAGIGCEAGKRGSVGGDGFRIGLTADKEEKVVRKSAVAKGNRNGGEVEGRRQGGGRAGG